MFFSRARGETKDSPQIGLRALIQSMVDVSPGISHDELLTVLVTQGVAVNAPQLEGALDKLHYDGLIHPKDGGWTTESLIVDRVSKHLYSMASLVEVESASSDSV